MRDPYRMFQMRLDVTIEVLAGYLFGQYIVGRDALLISLVVAIKSAES